MFLRKYPKRILLISCFMLYALIMIITELLTSQQYIRHYVTDISGPVFFFAINTTLSAFLLLGASLLFLLNHSFRRKHTNNNNSFALSQVLIFGFLGLDDRFLFHEKTSDLINNIIQIELIVYPGLFLLQAFLIFNLAKEYLASPKILINLCFAILFFSVMFVIDIIIPLHWPMRLATEDTAKVLGSFFLLLYAWDAVHLTIQEAFDGDSC